MDQSGWTIETRGNRVRIELNGEHYYTTQEFREKQNADMLRGRFFFAAYWWGHPFASESDPNPTRPAEPDPDVQQPTGRTLKPR